MIGVLPALLIAGALAVAPAGPAGRVTTATPKAPRDGPFAADAERCASDIELFAACVSAGLPAGTAAAAVADTHLPAGIEIEATVVLTVGHPIAVVINTVRAGRHPPCLISASIEKGTCIDMKVYPRGPVRIETRRNGKGPFHRIDTVTRRLPAGLVVKLKKNVLMLRVCAHRRKIYVDRSITIGVKPERLP